MNKVLPIILLIALAALVAAAIAIPPASRDLIRVGPITAWNSAQGDPSHSFFCPTALVRAPLAGVLSRVRLVRIAVDVDIYDAAGAWLGHASGVGPIRLVADDYPQQPAGFASVAGINAPWDQRVLVDPIQAEPRYTAALVGQGQIRLSYDMAKVTQTIGGGAA